MAAAYVGNYDIAEELLELKADPNVETFVDDTQYGRSTTSGS